jgi:hypothetical protein
MHLRVSVEVFPFPGGSFVFQLSVAAKEASYESLCNRLTASEVLVPVERLDFQTVRSALLQAYDEAVKLAMG